MGRFEEVGLVFSKRRGALWPFVRGRFLRPAFLLSHFGVGLASDRHGDLDKLFVLQHTGTWLRKSALCHFNPFGCLRACRRGKIREKSSLVLPEISQSLRSFEMTPLFIQLGSYLILFYMEMIFCHNDDSSIYPFLKV
jgi:hypothetical protein